MRRRLFLLTLVLVALPVTGPAAGEDAKEKPPFPTGISRHAYGGIRFTIHLPVDYSKKKTYSLLFGLHGAGATDQDFATWFEPLVPHDVIVVCPKSAVASWATPDLKRAKTLILHLMKVLPIDEKRMHGIGFSNGGAHLGTIVFDKDLPFATGAWMGSGFSGGKVPKRAKTEFTAIVMVGEKDSALGAAKATVKMLRKKVRRVDFESQPDLDHKIPDELMPFYYYWLRVMEGRFHPGDEESLDWHYDLQGAVETVKSEKRGGLFYFFDEKDVNDPDAKHAQNVVLLDPAVRPLARKLVAGMADAEVPEDVALMKKWGVTKTPGFVVLAPDGTVVAKFEGEVEAKALAAALAKVTPRKR